MKVFQFPLVKITLWFVLGILFAFNTNLRPKEAFSVLIFGFLTFVFSYLFAKKVNASNIYFGITLYFLSFCIGATTKIIHTDTNKSNNYIHRVQNTDSEQRIYITLKEKLKDTKYCNRYIAHVKSINQQACTGIILVNFYKNKTERKFIIGNNIFLKGIIKKHVKPKNPNQFDYGQYLTNKSILSQIYVYETDYIIGNRIEKNIWYYSNQIRDIILSNLKNSGFNPKELNVVSALILGQQQNISPDILKDYQFAGAIHILSVSGLHVGYLLLCLTFILNAFPKTNFFEALKLAIILLSLWGFAILASLSPSVVRSVTMFSIVAIGMHLKRKTNIYNTLCISIFIILLFEPSFLFDVGFQLSYAALFFIVWLQPLLSEQWQPKYTIVKYLWQIITVSFAAQVGTLPLSIYYFHQFPGLFFLTNIIILPGLGFIMLLGVFVMILAVFNIIPIFLSKTLEWSIRILNDIIHWIASFENFILKNISFNGVMLITLYLLIISIVIWFKKPNYNKILVVLVSTILFQTAYLSTIRQNESKKEFIVFNVNKSTLIGDRNGSKITLISNDSIDYQNMLQTYLTANFNPKVKHEKLQNAIFFKNNKILVIDKLGVYPNSINPDIVIISKSPKLNLERMLGAFRPKVVVADASNFKSYVKKWKETCVNKKIPFHSTSEKGYYKLE